MTEPANTAPFNVTDFPVDFLIVFLQEFFLENCTSLGYDRDPKKTNLQISDEHTRNLPKHELRPQTIVSLQDVTKFTHRKHLDDRLSMQGQTQAWYRSQIYQANLNVACQSKEGAEAKQIAGAVFNAIEVFRPALRGRLTVRYESDVSKILTIGVPVSPFQPTLHEIEALRIGPESVVRADSDHDWISVGVHVQIRFQKKWLLTPTDDGEQFGSVCVLEEDVIAIGDPVPPDKNLPLAVVAPGFTYGATWLSGITEPGALAYDTTNNVIIVGTGVSAATPEFVRRIGLDKVSTNSTATVDDPDGTAVASTGLYYAAGATSVDEVKFETDEITAEVVGGFTDIDDLAPGQNGLLYVAEASGKVWKVDPVAATKVEIEDLTVPVAISVDLQGFVWIAKKTPGGGDDLFYWNPADGSLIPWGSLSAELVALERIEIDRAGTFVWIAGERVGGEKGVYRVPRNGTISDFEVMIRGMELGLNRPEDLVFDSQGQLYVSAPLAGSIFRFTP